MTWFGKAVTLVVVSTWVFPAYFFFKDMIFGWDWQFARGMFCGVLFISVLLAIAERLNRCSARPKTELLEPDSEPWHSSKHYRR